MTLDPNSLPVATGAPKSKKALVAVAVLVVLGGGAWFAKDRVPAIDQAFSSLGKLVPGGNAGAPTGSTAPAAAQSNAAPAQAPAGQGAPAAANPSQAAPAAAPAAKPASGRSVSGVLSPSAGDTLTAVVKLKGVISPPPGDTCANAGGKEEDVGIQARTALGMLVGTGAVSCSLEADGAICSLADGTELNSRIVELGWGIARRGSPHWDKMVDAHAAKRGLWGACATLALPTN